MGNQHRTTKCALSVPFGYQSLRQARALHAFAGYNFPFIIIVKLRLVLLASVKQRSTRQLQNIPAPIIIIIIIIIFFLVFAQLVLSIYCNHFLYSSFPDLRVKDRYED
jgi:hypothetical protein